MIIVKNLDDFNQIKKSLIENPDDKGLFQQLLDFEFDIAIVEQLSKKDVLKNGLFAAIKLIDNLCGVEYGYQTICLSEDYKSKRFKLIEDITAKIEEYLIAAGNPHRELLSSLKD